MPLMKNSTIHNGIGITPAAPWMRSWRASSRSEVWSSHFPKAASSLAVCGSISSVIRNISAPHGLMASPSVPSSMASHSEETTKRP